MIIKDRQLELLVLELSSFFKIGSNTQQWYFIRQVMLTIPALCLGNSCHHKLFITSYLIVVQIYSFLVIEYSRIYISHE